MFFSPHQVTIEKASPGQCASPTENGSDQKSRVHVSFCSSRCFPVCFFRCENPTAPLWACGATPCGGSRPSESFLSVSGVCLGDDQTEPEGVPSQSGRGDAMFRCIPPYLIFVVLNHFVLLDGKKMCLILLLASIKQHKKIRFLIKTFPKTGRVFFYTKGSL